MWTKENIKKLIHLIKQNRCLWDSTDENRKKKGKIGEAHEAIAHGMPCSVEEVKKKINSLRSQMNAERTKVAKGGKSGAGGSETYVPKWDWYNPLLFMFEGETIQNETADSLGSNSSIPDFSAQEFLGNFHFSKCGIDENRNSTPSESSTHSYASRKRKINEDKILEQCLQTVMAPPPMTPQLKFRTKALLDSITALMYELEKEDESLGVEFTRELRSLLNKYEDEFDKRMNKMKNIEFYVSRLKHECN